MKKIFLFPAAIMLLFTACEPAEQVVNEHSDITLKSRDGKDTAWDLYKNCVDTFTYDNKLSYEDNVFMFEIYTNKFLNDKYEDTEYEKIDLNQLNYIIKNSDEVFQKLSYKKEVKEAISSILKNKEIEKNTYFNENEKALLQTLKAFQSDGNDDDQLKKNIKTIAFAYGAQYSFKSAVMFAGAIEIAK